MAGAPRPLPLSVQVGRERVGRRLYVPRGPACAPDDVEAWGAVLSELEAVAAACGAASVVVEPAGWEDDAAALTALLGAAGYASAEATQPVHTAVVDLEGGIGAVLGRMRPKGRYNARLAERRGVVVHRLEDAAEAAAALAALFAATAARQRIHQPDEPYCRRVLEMVPGATAWVAGVDGEDVAGALTASLGAEAVYLFGGSTGRHRERQPSALLHLRAMEGAIAAGCRTYDLWGLPPGDDPGHAWHGLRQFKLSLGGVERSAPGAWRKIRRPGASRVAELVDGARRRARATRRRLSYSWHPWNMIGR